jgi:hypothetical protein
MNIDLYTQQPSQTPHTKEMLNETCFVSLCSFKQKFLLVLKFEIQNLGFRHIFFVTEPEFYFSEQVVENSKFQKSKSVYRSSHNKRVIKYYFRFQYKIKQI